MKIILELEPNEILSNITAFSDFLSHFGNESEVLPKANTKCLKTEENTQKSKGKSKEERVIELKEYANSIWKDLSDAKKKSLKSFVSFYEKKINEENFTINVENQFKKWWERDKNNK